MTVDRALERVLHSARMTRPRLSLILPAHGVSFAETLAVARAAERAGLDGIWVPDHLLNSGAPRHGVLECWTTLAGLAATTERIPLGTLVLSTPFRHPPMLAKQAATLAVAAPGRLRLGLGAGGFTYDETCAQLGYPVLSPRERLRHVEVTIGCLRALLGEDPGSFRAELRPGLEVNAEGARIYPRPEVCPPLIVAARAPGMLRLAARLADGWNCPLPEALSSGLQAIERAGRARDTLDVSVFAIAVLGETADAARASLERAGSWARLFGDVEKHHVFGEPERAAEQLRALARAGADEVTLDPRGQPPQAFLDLLRREVIPLLEE